MAKGNTLAYFDMVEIKAVKSFIVQVPVYHSQLGGFPVLTTGRNQNRIKTGSKPVQNRFKTVPKPETCTSLILDTDRQ